MAIARIRKSRKCWRIELRAQGNADLQDTPVCASQIHPLDLTAVAKLCGADTRVCRVVTPHEIRLDAFRKRSNSGARHLLSYARHR